MTAARDLQFTCRAGCENPTLGKPGESAMRNVHAIARRHVLAVVAAMMVLATVPFMRESAAAATRRLRRNVAIAVVATMVLAVCATVAWTFLR